MDMLDDVRETVGTWPSADHDETVGTIDVIPYQPIDIVLVPEWMPVDPARSIEAAVIAAILVSGWALAIWAYVQLTA
ncbi:hypothetical protein [Novosphingobium taihuense]|uniref:Uncharacterized protein n=1 Tax=Novosphingobium taihuense TaxID=260085 RepID=A0A7W7A7E5_9SPHN|nr:hypothetical protein [Novosphingobium taihuense]MBB4611756.1 hypothetical protein [Novosphingobium taihuense]TWH88888.1 hypothetical protein IQ25_01014 [Novosphingobium taihuense]